MIRLWRKNKSQIDSNLIEDQILLSLFNSLLQRMKTHRILKVSSDSLFQYSIASKSSSNFSAFHLFNMQIIVRFTCFLFITLTSFSLIYTHKVTESGDILLGGLFPIHQKGIEIISILQNYYWLFRKINFLFEKLMANFSDFWK